MKFSILNLKVFLLIPASISLIYYAHLYITSQPFIDDAPLLNASYLIEQGFQIYTNFESGHPPLATYFLFILSKIYGLSSIKIFFYKITYFILNLLSCFFISKFAKFILEKNKINLDFSIIFLIVTICSLNVFIPTLGNGLLRGEVLAFFGSSFLLFFISNISKKNYALFGIFGGFLIFTILFSSPRFFASIILVLFFLFSYADINLIKKFKVIIISLFCFLLFSLILFNFFINFNDMIINVLDFNFHPPNHTFIQMMSLRIERLNYIGLSPIGHFLTFKYTMFIFFAVYFFSFFIRNNNSLKNHIIDFVPIVILFIDFYFMAKNGDGAQQSFSSFSFLLISSMIFYSLKYYTNIFFKISKFKISFSQNIFLFFILSIFLYLLTTNYYKKMIWFNDMSSFNKLEITKQLNGQKITQDQLKNYHNGLIPNLGSWYYYTTLLCNSITGHVVAMDWEYAPGCQLSPSHYRSQYRFYAYHPQSIARHGELNFLSDLKKQPVIIDNAVYIRFNTKTKSSSYSENELLSIYQIIERDYVKLDWGYVLKDFYDSL